MKLICKLLRQDPDSREGIITGTSGLGIIANLLIAVVKISLGLLSSSIAIISEGVNNATDALTSVLTLVGTKLANKKPDKKHPFGYGRIEYLTSLIIAVMILVTGVEMLISSVQLILHPAALDISLIALIAIAVSAVVKFFLGVYTMRMGKKTGSGSLYAVGLECRNDSFISVITIVSAVIFIAFRVSVDAYVGAFMSLVILKSGLDVLKETVTELLGRPGKAELAAELYHEIRTTKGIINAADMMLHNYGPNAYSGSVNVEIDHETTVGEVYQSLHDLQLRIMHEKNVTMVFGIYAVNDDHEETRQLRRTIGSFVKSHDHVVSFHAVYLDSNSSRLYCDLVVDYELRDWDALRQEFLDYIAEHYPQYEVELTVETEFV